MNILILGDDIVAWTMAAALASTGCSVNMASSSLPHGHHEALESELFLMLTQQQAAGRLRLGHSKNTESTVDLLIDAREHQTIDAIFQAVKDTRFPSVVALVHAVPIGTTDALQDAINKVNQSSAVVYWPNFIQAGRALPSFTRVEQLLLGSERQDAIDLIKRLMLPFNRSQDRFQEVTAKEAELAKIAINGMLATRISFMNELAHIAEAKGIDIEAVRQCMGRDSRIGFQYLYPGCGFAGNALTESLQQLHAELKAVNAHDAGLLNSVLHINEQQKDLLFQKFWRFYNADVKGKCVAIWGAAYKPNTTSVAGSPALHLIDTLISHGVDVRVYDPLALANLHAHFGDHDHLNYCQSAYEACQSADTLMVITEWKEFWNVDLDKVKRLMRSAVLLDGRNLYDPSLLASKGWYYSGVGRVVSKQ